MVGPGGNERRRDAKGRAMAAPIQTPIRYDKLRHVRRHLRLRVQRLPALARSAKLVELVTEIDRLRRLAQHNDMPCVVDIAHRLEALAASGWSLTIADHYFAAMDDAIAGDAFDPMAHQAVLASVAVHRMI